MFSSGTFQSRIVEVSIGVGTVIIASLFTFHFLKKPRKISRIIDTMDALKKRTVHIKDRDHVEELVSQIIKGGASKLQVISDFDYTLSRNHKNGEKCATTYGILKHPSFISEEYRIKTNQLFAYYHPIEIDPNLSKDQKIPHMIDWYTKNVLSMPISGVTETSIPAMVEASNACLRDGCDAVFNILYKHNVPLLILSAGIGDILKEILRSENVLMPNIKIIANFLRFDEKDKLLGFKGDLIHTYNKSQGSLQTSDYFSALKSRNNIILLGDSLGDLDMAEGAENVNVVLKIGFLSQNIENSLKEYMDKFDIVLTDDQTMDVVYGLLQSIL